MPMSLLKIDLGKLIKKKPKQVSLVKVILPKFCRSCSLPCKKYINAGQVRTRTRHIKELKTG